MACRNLKRRDGIHPGAWMSENGRLCCKNRKSQGHEFFAKTRNGKQSLIRIDAIALSKSPVSLTLGDEVPHIFTRKPRLRPLEFLILGAKRLLRHNQGGKMDIGPWRFNVQSKDDALEFLMNLDVTFTSPYARLARILVLEDRVEIVAAKTRVADTFGRVWELDDASE